MTCITVNRDRRHSSWSSALKTARDALTRFRWLPGEVRAHNTSCCGACPQTTLAPAELLDELEIQSDAHAVDEDDALICQVLAGDFVADEGIDGLHGTDEFYRFGGILLRA